MIIKKILVTGGSGKLGRAVLDDLAQHNYRGINVDRVRHDSRPTIKADLMDFASVISAAKPVDAIVHLAAIPSPFGYTPHTVFENNVISTFNIMQTASDLGIQKVVFASSLASLGTAFKTHPVQLHYLPIDEDHPLLAQDAYGICKMACEQIADGFARLHPEMSIMSFRFPLLVNPNEIVERVRPEISERVARGAGLWSYLDVRDAATVIRQALEANLKGHEVFYANAPDTFSDVLTLNLVKQHLKSKIYHDDQLTAFNSPINCDKARDMLGFNPRFGWREQVVQS